MVIVIETAYILNSTYYPQDNRCKRVIPLPLMRMTTTSRKNSTKQTRFHEKTIWSRRRYIAFDIAIGAALKRVDKISADYLPASTSNAN